VGRWAQPLASHRHPRYATQPADGQPLAVFAGKSFLVACSSDPAPAVLRQLIRVGGGSVQEGHGARTDFLVLGGAAEAAQWREGGFRAGRRGPSLSEEAVRAHLEARSLVTCKVRQTDLLYGRQGDI